MGKFNLDNFVTSAHFSIIKIGFIMQHFNIVRFWECNGIKIVWRNFHRIYYVRF